MKKISMNKRHLVYAAAVIALVGLLIFTGGAVARYIATKEEQQLITAREFRFESNYLKEVKDGETIPTYHVYGDSVTIELYNHDGLTVSEDNVVFEITATGGTLDSSGGTIEEGGQNSSTITLTGSGTVTVTARSTSRYAKTLQAVFVFDQPQGYYTVTDGDRYVQIDVYTGNALTGLTFAGMDGLTYDKTNPLFDGNGNALALEADSHYSFVFFKRGEGEYRSVSEKTPIPENLTITLGS